jgi:hypothetical protein
MFEGRSIPLTSGVENIENAEYDLSDEEKVETPFEVVVVSMDGTFLGYGQVLGKIIEDGMEFTVVRMDDPNAPRGMVHLIAGVECQWQRSTEAVKRAIAEKISDGYPMIGPFDYARALDRKHGSVNN